MTADIQKAFEAIIARLAGMPCWSVQVSGVGSLVNLHFGGKIKRDAVMDQPDFKLSVDERVYQGEVVLYLEECPWRLDGADAVICSWMDDSTPGGALAEGIMQLRDDRVLEAQTTRPGYDLTLRFESGRTLRVFPDQVDPDEGDNYAVTADGRTYVLAARATLYLL